MGNVAGEVGECWGRPNAVRDHRRRTQRGAQIWGAVVASIQSDTVSSDNELPPLSRCVVP